VTFKLGVGAVVTMVGATAFALQVGDAAAVAIEIKNVGVKLRGCKLFSGERFNTFGNRRRLLAGPDLIQ